MGFYDLFQLNFVIGQDRKFINLFFIFFKKSAITVSKKMVANHKKKSEIIFGISAIKLAKKSVLCYGT